MKKLSIVFPALNQPELTRVAVEWAVSNLSGELSTEVLILDNGSAPAFPHFKPVHENVLRVPIPKNNGAAEIRPVAEGEIPRQPTTDIKVVHLEKNIGVYPTFWEALKHTDGEYVAFFHSDLIISEKGWDKRVVDRFEKNPKLGMVGFIGSSEIDPAGGRGLGTTSNFQGDTYISREENGQEHQWHGSHAAVHGKHSDGCSRAAVVDGCSMIFRRSVLEAIPQRENFPPHHFYDRLLSCEVRERDYDMEVIGIACDHISGQTVNQEPAYEIFAENWATTHGLPKRGLHNWDSVLYQEAEKQWLTEYRDQKHLVPCYLSR